MARLLPELTPENTAYWTGGARGELLITRCEACDKAIHPPQLVCPRCLSDKVEPQKARGTGVVQARTVNRQKWAEDLVVPFVLAVVGLDGEPDMHISAKIVECDPEAVKIGDRVEVVFEEDRGIWFPAFRPTT